MTSWFCGRIPEPDPPQSFPAWKFSNGTSVYADSFDSAIRFLRSWKYGSKAWASETEPGMWDVQFDEYVMIENVVALTYDEAVRFARQKASLDASCPKKPEHVAFA